MPEEAPKPTWKVGFWFWRGSSTLKKQPAVDVLFVQAGSISKRYGWAGSAPAWEVERYPIDQLPEAKEYWLVFRFEDETAPDLQTVPSVVEAVADIRRELLPINQRVQGIQLDIDCPTRTLGAYARYLDALRRALPAAERISITALLDWFRPNTEIDAVIKAVDEFVPQFYDLDNPGRPRKEFVIAAAIEAARWRPIFNRFRKTFRIGVSTFGRGRLLPRGEQEHGVRVYPELKPLHFGVNKDFELLTSQTDARELRLRYRAMRATELAFKTGVEKGQEFEFVLATPASIQMATEAVKQMGEYCGGVVYFRWPEANESMAPKPDEVLAAIGRIPASIHAAALERRDGKCALVQCTDLYLLNTPALRREPVHYVIQVSTDMEYFLPGENLPVAMSGPRQLRFTLPPYGGRNNLHLGRAVTEKPAEYKLEVRP